MRTHAVGDDIFNPPSIFANYALFWLTCYVYLCAHRLVNDVPSLCMESGQKIPLVIQSRKMHDKRAAATIFAHVNVILGGNVRVQVHLWTVFDMISYALVFYEAHDCRLLPPNPTHLFVRNCPCFREQCFAPCGIAQEEQPAVDAVFIEPDNHVVLGVEELLEPDAMIVDDRVGVQADDPIVPRNQGEDTRHFGPGGVAVLNSLK